MKITKFVKFNSKTAIIAILIVLFIAGYFILLNGDIYLNSGENFDASENRTAAAGPASGCPNILVKDGNDILLYNTEAPRKEGENPLKFKDLDDYSEYLEEQYKNGVNCPVLFLQKESDVQNNDVYRIRQSPFYIEGGLPALPMEIHDNSVPLKVVDASRENGYNTGMYAGFDPYGFDIGRYTELDVVHDSTSKTASGSINPADPNWLGVISTQKAVDDGVFKENEVVKAIYPKARTVL
jgi:hypothetical protein